MECERGFVEMYHVRNSVRQLNYFSNITIMNNKGQRLLNFATIKNTINRKQIPLCKYHQKALYSQEIKNSDTT